MPLRRSTWRPLFFLLAALYLLGTLLGGVVLGWIALRPPRREIPPSTERQVETATKAEGAEFRSVKIAASDGAILGAWYMRPRDPNGNAVILLHGVGDNRLGMYGYGKWLLKNHYAVLLPDARWSWR